MRSFTSGITADQRRYPSGQMEQERIERKRHEALERDLYEKRGAMGDAEKRLKAADNAIRREDYRSVDTQHKRTPSVRGMQEEEQEQYN